MMCSPLVANASSEEDEWHTNYVYELEEISLSEVSDSYIQSMHISHEATDRKIFYLMMFLLMAVL